MILDYVNLEIEFYYNKFCSLYVLGAEINLFP
jgi:hypothetical protein